jgi:Novel STAND NTPase 1
VDQLEEIFTTCGSDDERATFIAAVTRAASDAHRAVVVLAMRSDYHGDCAWYLELAELLSANHVLVGPMTQDELRRAIELPLARAVFIPYDRRLCPWTPSKNVQRLVRRSILWESPPSKRQTIGSAWRGASLGIVRLGDGEGRLEMLALRIVIGAAIAVTVSRIGRSRSGSGDVSTGMGGPDAIEVVMSDDRLRADVLELEHEHRDL